MSRPTWLSASAVGVMKFYIPKSSKGNSTHHIYNACLITNTSLLGYSINGELIGFILRGNGTLS